MNCGEKTITNFEWCGRSATQFVHLFEMTSSATGAAYETNFNRKILIAVGSGTPLEPYSLKTNGERVWQNHYLKTQF